MLLGGLLPMISISALFLITSILALCAGATRFTAPTAAQPLDITVTILSAIVFVMVLARVVTGKTGRMEQVIMSLDTLLVIAFLVLCAIDWYYGTNTGMSITLIVLGCVGILVALGGFGSSFMARGGPASSGTAKYAASGARERLAQAQARARGSGAAYARMYR